MKSLLAILALTTALGGGYWFYSNPGADLGVLNNQATQRLTAVSTFFGVGKAAELETALTALDANKTALDEANNRLEVTETQLAESWQLAETQKQALADMAAANSAFLNRFERIEESLETMDGAVRNIDKSQSNQQQNLSSNLTGRMDQREQLVSDRLTALGDKVTALSERLSAGEQESSANLDQREQALNEQLTGLSDRVTALSERLSADEQDSSANLDQREQALNEQFTGLSDKVTALSERLTAGEQDSSANLEQREQAVNEQLTGLSDKVTALSERLNAGEQNNSADLETLQTTISDLQKQQTGALLAVTDEMRAAGAANTTSAEKINSAMLDFTEQQQTLSETSTRLAEQQQALQQATTRLNEAQQKLLEDSARLDAAVQQFAADSARDNESLAQQLTDQQAQSLEKSERGLRQSINGLQTQFTTLSAISGDTQSALSLTGTLDERMSALENSLAEIDKSAAFTRIQRSLNDRFAQFGNERDTQVDAQLSELQSAVTEKVTTTVGESVASNNTSLKEALDTGFKEQQTRLTDLTSQLTALSETSADLSGKVTALEAGFDASQNDISAISTRLTQLSDAKAESDSIALLQSQLQTRLDTLEQGVSEADEENLELLEGTLAQSRARIEQLEARVADLPQQSEQASDAQAFQQALQLQVATLEKQIAESASRPNEELISTIDQVRKKVTELEQREYLTPEDLAKDEDTSAKPVEYKIYFAKDSSGISPDAEKVLKSFITQEKNRVKSVSIFGFTDRSGNAAYNQRLALRRANRVRSYLIQQGFDFRKINAVDGLGEDLAASNADDGKEDANQRSVVLYAYQN